MTARREQEYAARLHLQEELDADKKAEQDYDELLRREAQQLNIKGFNAKVTSPE